MHRLFKIFALILIFFDFKRFEQGFTEALRLISTENRNNSEVIKVTAKWTLKLIDALSRIHNVFQPYTHQDRKNLIATFSQTRNWINSPIRLFNIFFCYFCYGLFGLNSLDVLPGIHIAQKLLWLLPMIVFESIVLIRP